MPPPDAAPAIAPVKTNKPRRFVSLLLLLLLLLLFISLIFWDDVDIQKKTRS
jgi:hypothetical protein